MMAFVKMRVFMILDKSIKHLKRMLNLGIDKIIKDEKVNITFNMPL